MRPSSAARAYALAGADMIFPEGLRSVDEFAAFRAAVRTPLLANMTEFGKSPSLTMTADGVPPLGLRRAPSSPSPSLRLAAGAMADGYAALRDAGSMESSPAQNAHPCRAVRTSSSMPLTRTAPDRSRSLRIVDGRSRMPENLARKIIAEHLVAGEMVAGKEIAIRVDQAFYPRPGGHGLAAVRVHGPAARAHRAGRGLHRSQHAADRLSQRRRPPLPAVGGGEVRRLLLPRRATASVTRCTWSGLPRPARRWWAPTATPPRPAAWARWPSAWVGWTWPSPWAAGRST